MTTASESHSADDDECALAAAVAVLLETLRELLAMVGRRETCSVGLRVLVLEIVCRRSGGDFRGVKGERRLKRERFLVSVGVSSWGGTLEPEDPREEDDGERERGTRSNPSVSEEEMTLSVELSLPPSSFAISTHTSSPTSTTTGSSISTTPTLLRGRTSVN